MIIENLVRDMRGAQILGFDFETTSLNLVTAAPWELAYIKGKIGSNETEEFERYLDQPNLTVVPIIKQLTGYNEEKFQRLKQPPKVVIEEFISHLEEVDFIFGHNIFGYDSGILLNEMDRSNISRNHIRQMLYKKMIDTLLFTKALPDRLDIKFKPGESLLEFQLRMSNMVFKKKGASNLGAFCESMGVLYEKEKAHRALYDCEVNRLAFLQLIRRVDITNT